MKNRIDLAKYFNSLGYSKGVEVGVCDGRYSEILLQTIPDLELWGVDPYTVIDKDSKGRQQKHHDHNLQIARDRLTRYKNYRLLIMASLEAAKIVPDGALDFVFIDANHTYEDVKKDIEAWYPKVRKGGILSGHDYYESKSGKLGVIKAVDEFVNERNITLQTTEWDYDAHKDDQQPDWYFVV